jgi:hypothetical protein
VRLQQCHKASQLVVGARNGFCRLWSSWERCCWRSITNLWAVAWLGWLEVCAIGYSYNDFFERIPFVP